MQLQKYQLSKHEHTQVIKSNGRAAIQLGFHNWHLFPNDANPFLHIHKQASLFIVIDQKQNSNKKRNQNGGDWSIHIVETD